MRKKNLKNKMIILCGGKGKRMGNVTKNIAKPMVKIGKHAIIEHKIKYYQREGINNFIFCLGYKSKKLKNFLKKKTSSKNFYDNGGIKSGILKRIYLVRKKVTDITFISYGDTLARINFKSLLINHKKSKCPLTIVAAPIQNPFGLVKWDKNGKVQNFDEKPILNHFIGYAVISPEFFKKIKKNIFNLSDGKGIVEAINYLSKKKQVNIYKFDDLQVTINSPDELKNAKVNYNKYFTL